MPKLSHEALVHLVRAAPEVIVGLLQRELGFELPEPKAGFFLFPRLPDRLRRSGASNDPGGGVALSDRLRLDHRTLVVPGTAFGMPGYLRLSMCVGEDVVQGALDAFRAACA